MTAPVPFAGDFDDIIIDSAQLIVDGTVFTLTRGGLTFEPGEEWDEFTYPGRTMATVGCRELVRLKPVIKGTALLTGEDQITAFRPDGVWADHATITGARTFTPNDLREYFTAADYLDVMCLWKRQRGDYIAVQFPVAVCGAWDLDAKDGDEGLQQIVLEAVQDYPTPGTTKTRPPYVIRTVPTPEDATDPPTPPVDTVLDSLFY